MHHVERRPGLLDKCRALGPRADELAVVGGRAVDKNTKARLEAELLREWFAGIACHVRQAYACGCGSRPGSGSGRGRGLPAGGTAEARGVVGSSTDSRFGFLPLMRSLISSPVSVSNSSRPCAIFSQSSR